MIGNTKHGSTVTQQGSRDTPSPVGRYPNSTPATRPSELASVQILRLWPAKYLMGESSALLSTAITMYSEIEPL